MPALSGPHRSARTATMPTRKQLPAMSDSHPGPPETARRDARTCLAAAMGIACAIVYGSLVPLQLKTGPLDSGAWLDSLRFTPWSQVSPTDVFLNAAVALPFGYCLMGAFLGTS